MIQGKYYAFTSASVDANTDLIVKAETLTAAPNIVAHKLRMISSGSLAFKVNNNTVSLAFPDSNGRYYVVALQEGDVLVNSLIITQTTACPVFLEIVY